MIRWVFLDIGGVILDEDVLTYHVFTRHAEAILEKHPGLTLLDLIMEREAAVRGGALWPVFEMASRYLDEEHVARIWEDTDREVRSRYADFLPPLAGSVAAIRDLASRYQLGLIANQPAEVRGTLDELGVLRYFIVVCLSEEVGFTKPDRRIFQIALDRAGIPGTEALMVGDRIRHDIAPASQLGMATALILRNGPRDDAISRAGSDFSAYQASLRRREAEESLVSDSGTNKIESLERLTCLLKGLP
ncbi:MAG: haloacid dehalogenase superfamily enzyme subfamily [Planctomycetota bacterium]|nr:haloacid dehalogenase superfamily enzyme subfamily [Planctomycetota bacterium]